MGAAASVEMVKPADASDISSLRSLDVARNEVMRLRRELGHLAKSAGFADVVYDASDLVLGENEIEDFNRCIAEIVHIRAALRLSTAQNIRRKRSVEYSKSYREEKDADEGDGKSDSDSSSASDD